MNLCFYPFLATVVLIFGSVTAVFSQNAEKAPGTDSGNSISPLAKFEAGKLNKEYPAFNFKLSNGVVVNSRDLRDKTVVIDCWFEYCHPCMAEVDALNELYDSLSSRNDIVFFSIAKESAVRLPEIIRSKGIRYPAVGLADSARSYVLNGGYPAKIIINKKGLVAFYHGGGTVKKEDARRYVLEEFYPRILEIANGEE